MLKPNSIIGILGGGQLGRMTAIAAAQLGYKVHVYTPEEDSPTTHIAYKTTLADYLDEESLEKFAKEVDLVSFEFENVPYKTLEILEKYTVVAPSSKIIKICQHRMREKDFINSRGIKTAPYIAVSSSEELQAAVNKVGLPCILKTAELGYDGKGQILIADSRQVSGIIIEQECVVEGFVEFEKEISVIVARNVAGEIKCYQPVENIHKNHILDETMAPAIIPPTLELQAVEIAMELAQGLKLIGVLAVEMFVTKDGLAVNELAPRPHNSGHHTIDSCVTSQFEQFVRAICGLPLGNVKQHSNAVMKNLIGEDVNDITKYVTEPNTKIHLYGKNTARPGRKMGHVTKLIIA